MSTDELSTDQVRDAFHSVFERAVGDVTADPALLGVVRRRHARQQRLLTLGAPLGVAVLTAGAMVGTMALHSGHSGSSGSGTDVPAAASGGGSASSRPAPTLQTVSLVGHDLSLPSDWTLSGNRRLIDLDTAQPGQPVGGKDQSVIATSPDGSRQFSATVYSGAIGDAERAGNSVDDDPTFTHVTIAGSEASFKVTDPATRCLTVSASGNSDTNSDTNPSKPGDGVVEGPCPTGGASGDTGVAAQAPYGEARYTFANGDFMLVDTQGMDAEVLSDFLTTALSG